MLAMSAVCLSAGSAALVLLFVVPQSALSERRGESATEAQYEERVAVRQPRGSSVGDTEQEDAKTDRHAAYARWLERENDALEAAGRSGPVSEGSVSGATAPAQELAVMEPPAPYSQVVDNASSGRFSERGWGERSTRAQDYGKDYSYVEPTEVTYPARFRVEIPATDHYTVYARWPAAKRNNAATLVGIGTTSGIEWVKVDQRRDGGIWVRLGAYEMEAGNRFAVQFSGYKAKGRVVADAVMVVRGTQVVPPETVLAAKGQARGQDVVQIARSHIGTPYVHSPPGSCEAHRAEDCSCLTSLVFGKLVNLTDNPVEQWEYGKAVEKDKLRPGDLVFFKEAGIGNPITHVGIYSGSGNMIHASSYWGEVVERPMEHVSGYYGAKRLGR
jgi:cell wall-associated NlpC family hydrolase